MKTVEYDIDWERVVKAAQAATNMLRESNLNSFVKMSIDGKDYHEIMNELIVCSLDESPDSSKEMFSKGSGESDRNLYLRMMHDFVKKCNKKKNELIYKNPLKNTDQVLYKLFEAGKGSETMKRAMFFKKTLSGKDLDIFDSLIIKKYVDNRAIAKKYGISEDSVTRAKNRLIRRYKDYMGLIQYYRSDYIEDLTDGIIRKEMRDYNDYE